MDFLSLLAETGTFTQKWLLLSLALDIEGLSLGLVANLGNSIGFSKFLVMTSDVKQKRLLLCLTIDLESLSLAIAGPGGKLGKSD